MTWLTPRIAIATTIVVFLLMFFCLPTKTEEQKLIEKSRAESFETISTDVVLTDAMQKLSEEDKLIFANLDAKLESAESQSDVLKQISGEWFKRREWFLAGAYADRVAALENNASAWSMAANSYAIGLQQYKDSELADYCREKAVANYQKAIDMDPQELEYKLNLAVAYAERPLVEEPMKGVMMLLDLDKSHGDDPRVQTTLAYYSIQTGQLEKAEKRLLRALELDSMNVKANCLMAKLIRQTGTNKEKLAFYEGRCE